MKVALLFAGVMGVCGCALQEAKPLAKPGPDAGKVVLMRGNTLPFRHGANVKVDGNYVGFLCANEYLELKLAPGPHRMQLASPLWGREGLVVNETIHLQRRSTEYFTLGVDRYAMAVRTTLQKMNPERARELLKEYKPAGTD